MITTASVLYEILYFSTIAPNAPITVVAEIAVKARSNNQRLGITGLLVFDGMHFCQQLEGSEEEIAALMDKISQDPRHTNIQILHQGCLDQRRFRRFSLGFTSVEDIELLERLQKLHGQDAVDAFVALLSGLDLDA
ncbi:MAG: hypothetical protein JWP96_1747 [Polaromonas sp.]|nr:hypothetical protein [Polaromonas sp.]